MEKLRIDLSVIIPVYNGSKTIELLVNELFDKLNDINFEIILINDGSSDESEFVCSNLAFLHNQITFISLRKNFGEHNAVLCGLNHGKGKYYVIIDDDFQHHPSEIKKLYASIYAGGYDVVYSKYPKYHQSLFRRMGSSFHNFVASYILDKPKSLYLSSFKIIKNDLVDEVIKYKGPYPYIDGLILHVTNNIGTCLVNHQERQNGKSNYTIKKLVSLYLNMFINHSIKPIRAIMFVGLIAFLFGISIRVYFFLNLVFNHIDYSTTVYHTLLFISLSGLQLLFMGILGEYIVKIISTSNGHVPYSIKLNSQSKKGAKTTQDNKDGEFTNRV